MNNTTAVETTNRAESNLRTNPLQAESVSDDYRAQLLEQWAEAITEGLGHAPLLMPLNDEKEPLTVVMGSIENAESNLVEPTEAARRIRQEGAEGFYVYAGRGDHRTEHLLILDHDNLDVWPTDTHRATVEVMSGSGSAHKYYQNDPDDRVRNANYPDSGGEIQAHNRGVVVPGSIHESGGIYHMTANPGMATLGDSDLSDDERPKGPTVKSLNDVDVDSHEQDLEVIGMVRGCLIELKGDIPSNGTARDRMQDLLDGKYRAQGFKSDNLSGDRSRAELALYRYIFGAVVEYGGTTQQEAGEAAAQYLTHIFTQSQADRLTEDGQPRKWLTNPGRYRQRIVSLVMGTHDHDVWIAWRDKEDRSGYHPMIRRHLLDAIEMDCRSGEGYTYDPEQYPKGRRVRGVAAFMNDYGLSDETYRTALSRLVNRRGTVKVACMDESTNDYRYYPAHAPDPEGAEYVRDHRGDHEPRPGDPT